MNIPMNIRVQNPSAPLKQWVGEIENDLAPTGQDPEVKAMVARYDKLRKREIYLFPSDWEAAAEAERNEVRSELASIMIEAERLHAVGMLWRLNVYYDVGRHFPDAWGESEDAPEEIRAIAPEYRGRAWNRVAPVGRVYRPIHPWWQKEHWDTRDKKIAVLAVTWALDSGELDRPIKADNSPVGGDPDTVGYWLGGNR